MIDRKSLTKALGRQELADWVLVERDQELAVLDDGVRRTEQRTRWQLVVHADTANGRGTSHVSIDANEGDPDKAVEQAAALARLSVGPAWATIPQAAPARVDLADPALATGELLAAADGVAKLLPRRPGATVEPRITVVREKVAVQARQGFHTEWSATFARVEALVIASGHGLAILREARRTDALDLVAAVDDAIADLRLLATAGPAVPGPCALILGPDAQLHGGLGVWQAFVAQADPVVARQGLTRYHERAPIVPGADQLAEPLTIESNGAIPFGTASAPLGDDGDAVRKWTLVERGIAAGLGLTPREAALRHREPNGGVRDLVVGTGTWEDTPGERPARGNAEGGAEVKDRTTPEKVRVIEIHRLRSLVIDPYTGDGDLELALAVDRASGRAFTGGTVRLDLIDALARARRSAKKIDRGAYHGPAKLLIERADLI